MAHGPPVKPVPTPPRGRPRSAAARARVLQAARALLEAQGPGAVTIEAVAARSGVSKPTIYRTWPNAPAVLMAALMDRPPASPTSRRRSPTVAGLRQQLRGIARTFASRTGRTVTMMLASAEADTELTKAFRHHFILARREEGRQLLVAAVATGELRHDLDVDVALDQLYGPIFFRLLVGHAPADEAFVNRLLAAVVGGLAAPRARR
ncbi:MAG: TetR/AcrR family transcriptional regulator [Acidobacteria bacterium]|nr:TetR/AcrR family transcriptional regulator [Acidobacteriota bacterium]